MTSPTTVTGVDFVTVFVKDYPAALELLRRDPRPRALGRLRKSPPASSRPAASPCR